MHDGGAGAAAFDRSQQQAPGAAPKPIPYPGRYVVVKQFAIDRPESHPLTDTTTLHHYYNPFYLRLDLKTHSTQLLHNSIQQTSVDATPEHHAAVVSGLRAGVALPEALALASAQSSSLLARTDRRSCSIASAGKKTVAFADTVDVLCDDSTASSTSVSSVNDAVTICAASSGSPPQPSAVHADAADDRRAPSAANVLQVHSQTGELVGDVLIERRRQPPSPSPSPSSSSATTTVTNSPSPVDEDVATASGHGRRKRHEMFCRRRQSPVYSCDDGATTVVDLIADDVSTSLYESCEDLPVVLLDVELGQTPLSSRSAAIRGYASCCPL